MLYRLDDIAPTVSPDAWIAPDADVIGRVTLHQGSSVWFHAVLRGERKTSELQVRVEPWLNRAVAFAHGLKYVDVSKGKTITLTPLGQDVAAAIDATSDVLHHERTFLTNVAKRATENIVTRIWRMETLL